MDAHRFMIRGFRAAQAGAAAVVGTTWVRVLALIYCSAWLVFHFACTALYLAPAGELKARTFDFVQSYIDPRFEQQWALFAPDPHGKTRYLLAECKVQPREGEPYTTPPYDLSQRLYASTWRTRLGPDFRLQRAYLSTMLFFDTESDSIDILRYRAKADPSLNAEIEGILARASEHRSKYVRQLAARIASAECRRSFPNDVVLEVRPMVDIVHPPPRAAGEAPPPAPLRIDFGWSPFVSDVAEI